MISERDVEAKFLLNLFCDILGYEENNLNYDTPVTFYQGREQITKKADLVISFNKKPTIVVEAKKPTESIKYWIDQVDSYAFALKTKYGLITNGKDIILRGYYEGNSRISIIESRVEDLKKQNWDSLSKIISIKNIQNSIEAKSNIVPITSNNEIKNYRQFFKSLHDIIRDGEKLDPANSFDELSKLLLIKVAESEQNKKLLTIEKIEDFEQINTDQAITYIQSVFQDSVKTFFQDVFDESEKINLTPRTVKELLKKLNDFNIKNGSQDVKGKAFEEFLPTQLRGKGLGQFFTPRPIVDFMVTMANVSIYDVIVDFSCGSGGFLIKCFDSILQDMTKLPDGIWERIGKTKNDFLDEVKNNHIHGIDAEPRAVRIAKMNMMLWGDGKKVVRGNGLDTKDKLGKSYYPIEYNKEYDLINSIKSGCSLILANPPFGSSEETKEILSRYELANGKENQKTEILFLEKGIKLLRPQGKMFIIIPEGIISNPTYTYVRNFIMRNADIKAIISLPTHTFVQSGVDTIKTVILYLEKFTEEKKQKIDFILKTNDHINMIDVFKQNKDLSYDIFMAVAEYVGFEPNGTMINSNDKTDLSLILEDFKTKAETINDIDIISFANNKYQKSYTKGSKGNKVTRGIKTNNKHISYFFNISNLENRLDPAYYFFTNKTKDLMKNLVKIDSLIEVSKNETVNKKTIGDNEYKILSCTTNGLEISSEIITNKNISKQKYIIVKENDIVYNPYRLNIGSIGIVTKEMDGALVSGAYVVFKCKKELLPDFLIDTLKTPFYKLYLDIITTGSIRDNLDYELLKQIIIPNVSKNEQLKTVSKSNLLKQDILKMQEKIKASENNINDIFQQNIK